jgi:hypothetical protein
MLVNDSGTPHSSTQTPSIICNWSSFIPPPPKQRERDRERERDTSMLLTSCCVASFQLLNSLNNPYETWYEHHPLEGNPTA